MTLNGIITYKRTVLIQTLLYDKTKGDYEIIPLDELLGINKLPFKMTKSMMIEVAYVGQKERSYKGASKELYNHFGYQISESLVRQVTIFVGNLVFERDKTIALNTEKDIASSIDDMKPKIDAILYILTDGAAINTRVQDENGSTWRENKLALVYGNDNVIKRGKSEKSGHEIVDKEYTAFIGNSKDFSKFIYQIAINKGYGQYKTVIILSDGATWIRTLCAEIFPDAIQILDKFHLDENIYNYAKYIFKNDEEKYKPWAIMIIKYIMEGKIDKALVEIEKYSNIKLKNGVVNIKTYINHNRDKINYPEYLSKGYCIGSGSIESGNKTVLQRRCKQAGMRWSPETAQPILTLRAKAESGLWNQVRDIVFSYE